jgi:hypothetical protein
MAAGFTAGSWTLMRPFFLFDRFLASESRLPALESVDSFWYIVIKKSKDK